MINAWLDFVRQAALAPGMTTGVRKIVFDQHFEMPWETLTSCPISYEDIAYTKAKGRQLERIYWPVPDIEAAFEKLKSRTSKPHSSVAIQLKNGIKDSRSQGRCLQTLVVTQTPDRLYIDISYRSTEVTQKFLADLIFFSQKLPAYFPDRTPSVVRFHFANAYISAVFAPILMRYDGQPLGFLREVRSADPKFFRTYGLSVGKNFNPICVYTYRTRQKMWSYHQEHVGVSSKKMLPVVKLLASLRGTITEEPEPDEL